MPSSAPLPRILLVDDDFTWIEQVKAQAHGVFRIHVEESFQAGMKAIDGRRRWQGAIFDRFLRDFKEYEGAPIADAAITLTAEFMRKFPGVRVSVASIEGLVGPPSPEIALLTSLLPRARL